jgi:hypothetical protein
MINQIAEENELFRLTVSHVVYMHTETIDYGLSKLFDRILVESADYGITADAIS